MATAESVKAKIQGLIDQSNEATGKEDTDLTGAVGSLIAGFGQGGGLAYDMGEFVLDSDQLNIPTQSGIPHALGEAPDFVLVWTDDFAVLSADNVNPFDSAINAGYIWLNGLSGVIQRLTSAVNSDFGISINMSIPKDGYVLAASSPTSASYAMQQTYLPTNQYIGLVYFGNAGHWKAGVKYKYFVSKAWWDVGGASSAE